jgi:hypothetical protein
MADPLLGRHRRGPLDVRFWRSVEKTEECWFWTASVNTYGYGQIRNAEGRYTTAHRISWMLANGPIPAGLCVLHRCDNTRCVRPDHLFLGTQQDNIADKVAKGRQARGSSHGMSKLTEAKVLEIRAAKRAGQTYEALAPQFGVSIWTIVDVCCRNNWAHISGGAA